MYFTAFIFPCKRSFHCWHINIVAEMISESAEASLHTVCQCSPTPVRIGKQFQADEVQSNSSVTCTLWAAPTTAVSDTLVGRWSFLPTYSYTDSIIQYRQEMHSPRPSPPTSQDAVSKSGRLRWACHYLEFPLNRKGENNFIQNESKHSGPENWTPVSHFRGPGFKSRSGVRLSWPWFLMDFLVPSRIFWDFMRIRPHPSQFITYFSRWHSTMHRLSYWLGCQINLQQIKQNSWWFSIQALGLVTQSAFMPCLCFSQQNDRKSGNLLHWKTRTAQHLRILIQCNSA